MTFNQQTIEKHYGIDASAYPDAYNIALDSKAFSQLGEGLLVCTDQFSPPPSMAVPFYKKRLPCLELIYFLSADASFSFKAKQGDKKQMAVRSGMRTAIFDTEVSGVCEADEATIIQSLYVYLMPEKIFSLSGNGNRHVANRLFSRISKENGYARPTVMSPAVMTIVHEIFHCAFCGVAKKLFVEGKILELLAHEIDNPDHLPVKAVSLNKEDIQQLQTAKSIMMENMISPPTIEELARLVGLNRKKIKMGFRQLYNKTVFGFLRQYRMEQARLMFEKSTASVTEAASAVGYTNISHFGQAFRSQFGIRPSDYLKSRKARLPTETKSAH